MTSSARRVSDHRAKMRAQGLRPVQLWVRDTSAPGFAEEARAWAESVAGDPEEDALDAALEAEFAEAAEGWVWEEDR